MAKSQESLLQEISGQLRKLNQTSIRDKLQEREAIERQEAVFQGIGAGGEGGIAGDAFVDATEDFRRRFVAGRAGTIFDEDYKSKYLPSEKQAKDETINQWFDQISVNTFSLKKTGELYVMLDTHLKTIISLMKPSLSDEEIIREKPKSQWGPGMHPNSRKNWIQPGWQNKPDPDAPDPEKKKWYEKLLGYPKTAAAWVVGAVGTALYDTIKGYDSGGLTGAIAGFFGGTGEGGLTSGIRGAWKGAGIGIAVGFTTGALKGGLIGGPVGALVGGILGAASFAILSYIGADKLKKWMDDTGAEFKKSWNLLKDDVARLAGQLGAWIYTEGEGSSATGGFKSKMFGDTIEWEPGKLGRMSDAWKKVVAKLEDMPNRFAAWFEGQLRGKGTAGSALADFLFGKEEYYIPTSSVGDTAAWAMANQGVTREEMDEQRTYEKVQKDDYNAGVMVLMNKVLQSQENLIQYGKVGSPLWTELTGINLKMSTGHHFAEEKRIAEEKEKLIAERNLAIMSQQTTDRNLLRQSGYSQPILIVDDKSDKSNHTTILNSTYFDHILGSGASNSNVLGSGNNPQVIQAEDGNIYSWQP
jgi:hypothetical protein